MSGSNKQKLLATVFSDYICPFCCIGFLRLEKLREDYDLKVNWCMLEIHPENPPEWRPASELAQWQEMMDILRALAIEVGVSLETIERAWIELKLETRLKDTRRAALELGVTSTPTFFIGKQKLVGAIPTTELRNAAQEALAP